MTSENNLNDSCRRSLDTLEEICENTRAIRRVVNRILDHLHEYGEKDEYENDPDYDPDSITWDDLDNADDMFL